MRVHVYVDGFNLYYGALKRSGHRWVDLVKLAEQLLPLTDTVEKVKYFTARVSGAVDPDAPRRQQAYLSALATLAPKVEIFYGTFLPKTIWRPIVNLPVAGSDILAPSGTVSLPQGHHTVNGGAITVPSTLVVGSYLSKRPADKRKKKRKTARPPAKALVAEVHTMEEKGSDVNLAAHLLNDGWKGLYEAACVISADTDLVTPIAMVKQDLGLPIYVVNTSTKWPISPQLDNAATYTRHIRSAMITAAQFPDPIGGIAKPPGW